MTRPKTYPDDLRDRLVRTALDRLRHHGPGAVSLRDLASSAETSTNAIYSMFGGKDGLLAEVIAHARREFVAHQQAIADRGPTLENFAEMGHHYRCWALANPGLYRLMFGGDPDAFPDLRVADAGLAPVHAMVRALADAGVVRDDIDVAAAALSAWANLHGFVILEMTLGHDDGFRSRSTDYFDFHLRQLVGAHLTGSPAVATA